MVTVFVKQTVEDYGTWKAKSDEQVGVREEYGRVGNERHFREVGEPNEIVLMEEWESMEGIQRFMDEQVTGDDADEWGVIGEPKPYFLEAIESKTPERPSA